MQMQCENGLFGRSDLIPLASSQILSDTSLGLGAADDGGHFYPDTYTQTSACLEKCLPIKCLPGQMPTRTHIPGRVGVELGKK